MENCLTCSEPTRKYRCSKCLKFSCSLQCYKKHKETEICSDVIQELDTECRNSSNEGQDDESTARLQMFNTEDTVESCKLKKLEHSPRILELLRNPHLRNFIAELDKTPDAWKAMKVAMLEPLFVEFANECMNVVEPDDSPLNLLTLTSTEEVANNLCTAIIEQMDS